MFKVNNKDTRTMLLASLNDYGVIMVSTVKFEHISHLVSVSIVNFERVIAGWVPFEQIVDVLPQPYKTRIWVDVIRHL